jgi:hypothetical protein
MVENRTSDIGSLILIFERQEALPSAVIKDWISLGYYSF